MTRITVLTGGSTPERPVALAGAAQVVAALRQRSHTVRIVDTCSGLLDEAAEESVLLAEVGREPPSPAEVARLEEREDLPGLVASGALEGTDVVFLVLHGRQGEGGAVQSLLELAGVRYIGSDSLGSTLAMDKDVSKCLMTLAGIPTAEWTRWPAEPGEVARLGLPLVVKPSRVGSTVGLSVVREESELDRAIGVALQFDREVLLESFVPGRELTVGVLAEEALAVGEIITKGEVFDFEAKYSPGMAEEVFPAEIDEDLAEELRRCAVETHRCLKLRDFSRVDFRLAPDGRFFVLEANTLPGMTRTSLLPQSAAAAGIAFPELCERMVAMALARSP